jgi:hypothetical protein
MNVFRKSLGSWGGCGGGDGRKTFPGRNDKNSLKEKVISVALPGGTAVIIPIDVSSTIEQVRVEAVRRGTAAGFHLPSDSILRTARGDDGAILLGEDRIVDVLILVENNTLWLDSRLVSIANGINEYC